jgi:hypothetical protein
MDLRLGAKCAPSRLHSRTVRTGVHRRVATLRRPRRLSALGRYIFDVQRWSWSSVSNRLAVDIQGENFDSTSNIGGIYPSPGFMVALVRC